MPLVIILQPTKIQHIRETDWFGQKAIGSKNKLTTPISALKIMVALDVIAKAKMTKKSSGCHFRNSPLQKKNIYEVQYAKFTKSNIRKRSTPDDNIRPTATSIWVCKIWGPHSVNNFDVQKLLIIILNVEYFWYFVVRHKQFLFSFAFQLRQIL